MRTVVAACALALAVSGCVPQTPDEDTYRDRTRLAITQTTSSVQTTRLVLRSLLHDDMLKQYAEVAIEDSEDMISSESSSYDALQPPRTRDHLYSSTATLMSDASSAVTDARIAVKRGDTGRYHELIKTLEKLDKSLDKKLAKVA